MARQAVLVHSQVVVAVGVVQRAQVNLVVLVALALRDMRRSTHGKLIRRDR